MGPSVGRFIISSICPSRVTASVYSTEMFHRCSSGVRGAIGEVHENRGGHYLLVWLRHHRQRYSSVLQERRHHLCVRSCWTLQPFHRGLPPHPGRPEMIKRPDLSVSLVFSVTRQRVSPFRKACWLHAASSNTSNTTIWRILSAFWRSRRLKIRRWGGFDQLTLKRNSHTTWVYAIFPGETYGRPI